jgi:hypothetical protein
VRIYMNICLVYARQVAAPHEFPPHNGIFVSTPFAG